MSALGWDWHDFDSFSRPGRSALPLSSGPDEWWLQELRDGLLLVRWAAAAGARQDMGGLDAPQGLDRCATAALLNSKLDPKKCWFATWHFVWQRSFAEALA